MMLSLDFEELLYLLNQTGFTSVSMEDEAAQKEAVQVGEKQLHDRGLAHDHAILQTVTQPTAVFRATRVQANKPDEDVWFFYTPSQTILAQKTAQNQYEMTDISGETAVTDHIQQFLPLQPTLPELTYRVQIPQEDFHTLRDLASIWDEVPALEILEADGLDRVTARDLFDSAVEPEWRGIIDCFTSRTQTTLRVLQGAEISWLIRDSSGSKFIIETAQTGHFEKAIIRIWNDALAD